MGFVFCTSGAAVMKAGLNVNQGITASGAALERWSNEAEGEIMARTRRDWSGSWSSLPSGIKYALSQVASSMIAKQMIAFDMSGYTSRDEAITMLNVQDDIIEAGLKVLEDFKSNTLKTP